VPVKYAQGQVTVRVITKDVWTLSPGVSFGRSGGANSSSVDLSDSNLLGSGKSLALTHASNVDRRSTGATLGDPNLLGWQPDCLFFAFLNGTTTHALDPDSQLLIGGDSGLRGYPLRYESGTSRGLLTLEQRFYPDWYPFRLARFGAAVFGDVGRTWGSGAIGNSDPGTLSDLGFGLRFGNTRSGLGNVLHIDVAFPLQGDRDISKAQLLVETKASY
jgi:hypothetical protein